MRSTRLLVFLATLVLLPTLATAATEYLVVTTDALAPAFQIFAADKAPQGYVVDIVTVQQIQMASLPGRDLAEQIRGLIQTTHAAGSLRFVLLGGDSALIPARFAYNDFYPSAGTSIPTDLYYAALDGNWDADGDDLFGEVGVDFADLDPEVAVGRAPVRNALEAARFVAKIAEYESPANTSHLGGALFLDEVLFPADWEQGQPISLDGALFGEEIRTIVENAPSPLSGERLYENHFDYPGSAPLTKQLALDALGTGNYGLVFHAGHGYQTTMSVGDAAIESADALGLNNGPRHFVLMSNISSGAAFDQDSILEEFVRNANGGAVAILGSSRTSFPGATQQYLREVHEELFLLGGATLGEALNAVRSMHAAAEANDVNRYTQLTLNLLGDPELAVGEAATAVSVPSAALSRILMHPVEPNPFNPSATIRFEILSDPGSRQWVTVAVFNAAGRRVRTLWRGSLAPGPQQFEWNGRDASGVELSSGTYFAAVEMAGDRHSAKMVLLK
jgi:hypothetical protein